MTPTYRPGALADSFTVYTIFVRALDDFVRRTYPRPDQPGGEGDGDPYAWWPRRQSLFEHLARTADQFWVAEEAGEAAN